MVHLTDGTNDKLTKGELKRSKKRPQKDDFPPDTDIAISFVERKLSVSKWDLKTGSFSCDVMRLIGRVADK